MQFGLQLGNLSFILKVSYNDFNSSYAIFQMYNNSLFAIGNFVEEILPGTDFLPTATIGNVHFSFVSIKIRLAWFAEQLGWINKPTAPSM